MRAPRTAWWGRLDPVATLVLGLAGLILLVFLVYPISRIVLNSFLPTDAPLALTNLTLEHFVRFAVSPLYRKALVHSLIVSLAASVLALLIGLPMAFFVARVKMPGKTLLLSLGTLPLVVPPFLGAYSWILLLGRNGILTNFIKQTLGFHLPSIYGASGIILAFTLGYFPYVFLLVYGALSAADPSLEESAEIMGGSRWRITRTLTLPLVTPAIAAGMVIIFMQSLGSFGVPAVLGGEYYVLTTLIYFQIVGHFDLNAGGAIALVSVAFTAVSLYLLHHLTERRSYITVTGATRAARQLEGRGIRILAMAYCGLVLGVALIPQALILMTSFAERWGTGALPTVFSLGNYRRVFTSAWGPMQNSLFLATLATVTAAVLGTLMAYVAVRKAVRGRWILDLTITLPFIFPGIAVGSGHSQRILLGMADPERDVDDPGRGLRHPADPLHLSLGQRRAHADRSSHGGSLCHLRGLLAAHLDPDHVSPDAPRGAGGRQHHLFDAPGGAVHHHHPLLGSLEDDDGGDLRVPARRPARAGLSPGDTPHRRRPRLHAPRQQAARPHPGIAVSNGLKHGRRGATAGSPLTSTTE